VIVITLAYRIGFLIDHFVQVGEKFRIRSLKFPGLLAGCTIDWFLRWPKDALYEVGEHFLEDYKVICSAEVKLQLMKIVGDIQDYMNDVCMDYFDRSERFIGTRIYIPSSERRLR